MRRGQRVRIVKEEQRGLQYERERERGEKEIRIGRCRRMGRGYRESTEQGEV